MLTQMTSIVEILGQLDGPKHRLKTRDEGRHVHYCCIPDSTQIQSIVAMGNAIPKPNDC
jgi:hypothetical protein